jgi:Glycosyl transferase family 8
VYCITNSKNDEFLEPLIKLRDLYDVDITIIQNDGLHFSTWKELPYVSQATYLRLLIPSLIPCQKAIYLDCDTLVIGDISKLFKKNLGQNAIGGPGFVEVDSNPNSLRELLAHPFPKISNGEVSLSDQAGLGIEPDLIALKPFLINTL